MGKTSIINAETYARRVEPTFLKRGDKYISLRACTNKKVLRNLIDFLDARGPGCVIIPWVSPPFGRVVGYGVYSRSDAQNLQRIAERDGWGFPVPGLIYDKKILLQKLNYAG